MAATGPAASPRPLCAIPPTHTATTRAPPFRDALPSRLGSGPLSTTQACSIQRRPCPHRPSWFAALGGHGAAQVIDKGVSAVYLEKPGAPTVAELEEMREYRSARMMLQHWGLGAASLNPRGPHQIREHRKCASGSAEGSRKVPLEPRRGRVMFADENPTPVEPQGDSLQHPEYAAHLA